MLQRYLQAAESTDDCTWWSTLSLGTDGSDYDSVIQLDSGSYIAVGGITLPSEADKPALLTSIKTDGAVEWIRAALLPGFDLYPRQVVEVTNGFVAIAEAPLIGNNPLCVFHFSKDGVVNWMKLVGQNYQSGAFSSYGLGRSIIKYSTNDLLLVGSMGFSTSNSERGIFINVTTDGSLNSAFLLGGDRLNRLHDAAVNSVGSVVAAGWDTINGRSATLLSYVPPNTINFAKIFQDTYRFRSVTYTHDGGIVAAGRIDLYRQFDWYIAKLYSNGSYAWGWSLHGEGTVNSAARRSLIELANGNLMFGGFSCFRNAQGVNIDCSMMVINLYQSGQTNWARSIYSSGNSYLEAILESDDGFLLIAGETRSVGSTLESGLLAKLTPQGDIIFSASSVYQIDNVTLTARSVPGSIMQDWSVSPMSAVSMDVIDVTEDLQLFNVSSDAYQLNNENATCATGSASVTATSSSTPSVTASATPSPSASTTTSISTSATPSQTASTTASSTITPSRTLTTSATITPTATISPTATSSTTASSTPSASLSGSTTASPSSTSTVTPSITATASLSGTTSMSPTASQSSSNTLTPSITGSASSSGAVTASASSSASVSPSVSASVSPSVSSSTSSSLSATASTSASTSVSTSAGHTLSASASASASATASPTSSATPTSLGSKLTPASLNDTEIEFTTALAIGVTSAALVVLVGAGVYFYYTRNRRPGLPKTKRRRQQPKTAWLWRSGGNDGAKETQMIQNPLRLQGDGKAPAHAMF